MESWPSSVLTHRTRERFGPGPAVRIYDTAANQLVDATPAAHEARLYACGITPYDATHLGHALMALSFDTLNRAWRSAGFDVRYVQNVTDVDEPLLERAALAGEKWTDLAQRQTQLYRDDMTALRIIGPDALVGATETVDLVADLVMRLRDAGAVYAVEDDLYFSVAEAPDFGRVSHFDRDTMLTWFREFGGDPDRPGKRDPLDCLVWRALRSVVLECLTYFMRLFAENLSYAGFSIQLYRKRDEPDEVELFTSHRVLM